MAVSRDPRPAANNFYDLRLGDKVEITARKDRDDVFVGTILEVRHEKPGLIEEHTIIVAPTTNRCRSFDARYIDEYRILLRPTE